MPLSPLSYVLNRSTKKPSSEGILAIMKIGAHAHQYNDKYDKTTSCKYNPFKRAVVADVIIWTKLFLIWYEKKTQAQYFERHYQIKRACNYLFAYISFYKSGLKVPFLLMSATECILIEICTTYHWKTSAETESVNRPEHGACTVRMDSAPSDLGKGKDFFRPCLKSEMRNNSRFELLFWATGYWLTW